MTKSDIKINNKDTFESIASKYGKDFYVAKDYSESWYNIEFDNVSIHCFRQNGSYGCSVWFKNRNYINNWHTAKYQTVKEYTVELENPLPILLRKALKLVEQYDNNEIVKTDIYCLNKNHTWKFIKGN